MKRIKEFTAIFVFFACTLLSVCGCNKNFPTIIENRAPEEALLTVAGETVMTVSDYNSLVYENSISAEYLGTRQADKDSLFKIAAEYACAAFFSELYGTSANKAELYESFDNDISEAKSNLDSNTLKYHAAMQKALGLSDEEYREWAVNRSFIYKSAQNLTDDIGSTFKNITDSELMKQAICETLLQMTEEYGISCTFEGYLDYVPSFELIV